MTRQTCLSAFHLLLQIFNLLSHFFTEMELYKLKMLIRQESSHVIRLVHGLNTDLQGLEAVFRDHGTQRPPPLTRVKPHTSKHGVSVCSQFPASISRCRLLSQGRELCFSRLRLKKARSRRQFQNDKIYNLRYYPSFLDIVKNIYLNLISEHFLIILE